MAWMLQTLRSRGRVPLLWLLIVCELATGILAVATHGEAAATKARAGGSSQDGVVNATPEETGPTAAVAAGPSATAAVQKSTTTGATQAPGPAGNSATNGPVTVRWGPGTVTVSWTPLQPGVQSYEVVANEASTGYSGTLVSCGTCLSVTFNNLVNGGRYTFAVTPIAGGRAGKAMPSAVALPNSDLCPPGPACVAVDATVARGTARGAAQGFLQSIDDQTDKARVAALKPEFWRGSQGPTFEKLVKPYGVVTTHVLSDYWVRWHWDKDKNGATPPWDDWDTYRKFISDAVKYGNDQGWNPWWEIQNEPDAGLPYLPGTDASIENTLAVYKAGYEAVKAADPNARIIGPSLTGFTIKPVAGHPEILDLTTFLDFANANHLRFDAIGLHETGADHLPHAFDKRPESEANHVARLEGELFKWPNIGHPKIFISEYGGGRTLNVPGWRAAHLAAVEESGVESATTSCWPFSDAQSCYSGTLDGLLDGDKSTPRAGYWVHRAYADMRGTRLDTSDSVPSLEAFAVAGGSGGPWQVLIGRDQSCAPGVNPQCSDGRMPAPIPVNIAVRVGGPDRTLTVTVERIPNTNGTVPTQPTPATQQFQVRHGVGGVTLPSFADGDAYYLRIT